MLTAKKWEDASDTALLFEGYAVLAVLIVHLRVRPLKCLALSAPLPIFLMVDAS